MSRVGGVRGHTTVSCMSRVGGVRGHTTVSVNQAIAITLCMVCSQCTLPSSAPYFFLPSTHSPEEIE